MNIKEHLQALKDSGVTSTPELDLRVLLQYATGRPREFFMARPEYELTSEETGKLAELVARRQSGEPIAYITGVKEFYGRDFMVTPAVLIPRPETEHIIDVAKELFKGEKGLKILDLGTGSGCILLTLLQELPESTGVGADISNNALAIARQNAYKLGIGKADFICSSWTKEIKDKQFDLIVSNPPYVERDSDKLNLETKFEPEAALFADENGLMAYRQIAEELKGFSFKFAVFEFGQGQEKQVKEIFENSGFETVQIIPDYAKIDRLIVIKPKNNNI